MKYDVYSPADVDISVGGVNIDGWDSVTITKATENTTKNIAADGPVGLTWTANQTGSFELEVIQQNSPVNSYCAALQRAQQLRKAPVYADVVVSDKSGGVLVRMKNCFLDMPADQSLATEASSRTWVFFVTRLEYDPNIGDVAIAAEAEAFVNTILNNTANR